MRLELLHDRETMYPVTSTRMDCILGLSDQIEESNIDNFILEVLEEFLYG